MVNSESGEEARAAEGEQETVKSVGEGVGREKERKML